jgi:hypothetical protein
LHKNRTGYLERLAFCASVTGLGRTDPAEPIVQQISPCLERFAKTRLTVSEA